MLFEVKTRQQEKMEEIPDASEEPSAEMIRKSKEGKWKRRRHGKLSQEKCCKNARQQRSVKEDGFVRANEQK